MLIKPKNFSSENIEQTSASLSFISNRLGTYVEDVVNFEEETGRVELQVSINLTRFRSSTSSKLIVSTSLDDEGYERTKVLLEFLKDVNPLHILEDLIDELNLDDEDDQLQLNNVNILETSAGDLVVNYTFLDYSVLLSETGTYEVLAANSSAILELFPSQRVRFLSDSERPMQLYRNKPESLVQNIPQSSENLSSQITDFYNQYSEALLWYADPEKVTGETVQEIKDALAELIGLNVDSLYFAEGALSVLSSHRDTLSEFIPAHGNIHEAYFHGKFSLQTPVGELYVEDSLQLNNEELNAYRILAQVVSSYPFYSSVYSISNSYHLNEVSRVLATITADFNRMLLYVKLSTTPSLAGESLSLLETTGYEPGLYSCSSPLRNGKIILTKNRPRTKSQAQTLGAIIEEGWLNVCENNAERKTVYPFPDKAYSLNFSLSTNK